MTFETDLVSRLENDSGVSALVTTRIYPGWFPQVEDWPGDSVAYEIPSNIPDRNLAGEADRTSPRVRIHCAAATFGGAVTLAAAVRSALNDFQGTMGSTPMGQIRAENETDLRDQDARYESAPNGLYRRVIDFVMPHR